MKDTLLFALSVLFFLLGCNKEETKQQENSIYGTWKLIERFDGGSPTPIQDIANGETISFFSDNVYSNDSYQCDGIYNIINSTIEISVPCMTDELIKYTYILGENELKLIATPSTCDEGCYDKYKKISSEE